MKKKNSIQQAEESSQDIFSQDSEFQKVWDRSALNQEEFIPDADRAWDRFQLKAQMRSDSKSFLWMKVAASLALIMCASALWYWFPKNEITSPDVAMISTNTSDTIQLINLPDGSQIWLKDGSNINYPKNFLENREIHLSGEAFFEVAKRNGQPFTIYTASSKTEVLGTSFLLKEKPNEAAEIQVTTGRVEFSNIKTKQQIVLTPGLQAKVETESSEALVPETIQDPNYRAWQNNVLTFHNCSLKQMTETLSVHFHTQISFAPELDACRLTVSFENQSLQDILDIISITGNFTVSKNQNVFLITGNPCL